MPIAQISDPHVRAPGKLLYRAIDTAAYLARAGALVTHTAAIGAYVSHRLH
jgi:hypothetical protein